MVSTASCCSSVAEVLVRFQLPASDSNPVKTTQETQMSKSKEYLMIAIDKGYYAQDDGSIVSPAGRTLSMNAGGDGYLRFSVAVGNHTSRSVAVHRLVAFQKFGKAMFEEGIEVRHRNGDPIDNSVNNILIGSHSENMMDRAVDQRKSHAILAAKKRRKLTDEQVRQLRRDRDLGMSYKELCNRYDISKAGVSYLLHGKTYATVE